jgi:NHL repeat-containing protein/IPT/TIG domain-containing protein
MIKNIITCLLMGCLFWAGLISCKKDNGFAHNPGAPIKIDSFIPQIGGAATEILISGANFSADSSGIQITINGHPLVIVGVNGHQAMAMIPKKCGTGHIVIHIGKDSVVSDSIFTYVYTHTVSTFAGNGTAGYADGQGTNAMFSFNNPNWYRSMGVAVDNNLNVYVADVGNHCVRKIDSLGNVTTLAGNHNTSGHTDGQGSSATFGYLYDLALDAAGNIYTADPIQYDIRKITPDGTTSTLGFGQQSPWCVAVDPTTGYVYYTGDNSPGNIYQITPGGTTTQVISGLNSPAGMAFDASGNLYAVIQGDQVIRKFAAGTWNATTIAGQTGVAGYVNGAGTQALFSDPWGLAVDAVGNLYVAGNGTWDGGTENPDQSIRYIEQGTWNVSTFAGSGTSGYVDAIGGAAAFAGPGGVAVDKNGTVYVLDKNNNRIRKIITE